MAKDKVKAVKREKVSEFDFSKLEDRDYRVSFTNGHSSEFHGAALLGGNVHFAMQDVLSVQPVTPDVEEFDEDEEQEGD